MDRARPAASAPTRAAASRSGQILDTLLAALKAERDALVRGETEAMATASALKSDALQQMAGALRAETVQARAEIIPRLNEAQRLNELNAALVASRAAVARARLDALLGAAGLAAIDARTYDARGALSR